jgi:hypothetical protein
MGLRRLPTVSSPEEREIPEGEPPEDMLPEPLEEEEPVSIGMDEEDEAELIMEEEAIGMLGESVLMAMEEEVEFMDIMLALPVAIGIMLVEEDIIMELELEPPPRAGPAIPPRRPERGPSREPVTEPTTWERGSELPLIIGEEPDWD